MVPELRNCDALAPDHVRGENFHVLQRVQLVVLLC